MDIALTDKARTRLKSLGAGQDHFLRISVVAGGCSGHTYSAALDHQMQPGDEVIYDDDGLRIVAEGRSSLFLDGLVIDYSDDLIKAGFRLSNGNAKTACGCGASFSM